MIRELKKAPWWAWVILGGTALIVVLAIVGASTGGEDSDIASAERPARSASSEPASSTSVSNPVATAATDAPPPPSATPAPPTATPVPVPVPITLSGVGQFVTEPFTPTSNLSRLVLTHNGASNFIVKAYDDRGNEDLLVNVIGRYAGSRPLVGDVSWFLEIDADGRWTVLIEPLGADPAASAGFSGTGDRVSGLFGPVDIAAVPFEVSNNGPSNFVVWLHCAGGSELVQNEIGSVQGSTVVRFDEGPCFWEVQSDGVWSLRAR